MQLMSLGGTVSPPQWCSGAKPRKMLAILNSSKHCSPGCATTNSDKNLHQKSTFLRVWESEPGIKNRYTTLKIALDKAQKVKSSLK